MLFAKLYNTNNSYNKSVEIFKAEKEFIMNLAAIIDELDNFLEKLSKNVEKDLEGITLPDANEDGDQSM